MRKSFPNLRAHDNEFTLEHCSALLEKLGKLLDSIYIEESFKQIIDEVDSSQMHEDLVDTMGSVQLATLFSSELGQGLILGIFFTHFVMGESEE
jgi:hypothetical protein